MNKGTVVCGFYKQTKVYLEFTHTWRAIPIIPVSKIALKLGADITQSTHTVWYQEIENGPCSPKGMSFGTPV